MAETVNITVGRNATGTWVFSMDNSSYRGSYNNPTLLLAKQGNISYPLDAEWNVYDTGSNASYRFVINNLTSVPHPMHFHGHNMFILVCLPLKSSCFQEKDHAPVSTRANHSSLIRMSVSGPETAIRSLTPGTRHAATFKCYQPAGIWYGR
jgi:Multicopper oxidase